MANPIRPDSQIQEPSGRITARWNLWLSFIERRVLASIYTGGELPAFVDDAAAEDGGVPLYGFYTASGVVRQRVV